jgi:hypothetical protein
VRPVLNKRTWTDSSDGAEALATLMGTRFMVTVVLTFVFLSFVWQVGRPQDQRSISEPTAASTKSTATVSSPPSQFERRATRRSNEGTRQLELHVTCEHTSPCQQVEVCWPLQSADVGDCVAFERGPLFRFEAPDFVQELNVHTQGHRSGHIFLAPEQDDYIISLLAGGYVLSGLVVDANGGAIPGALVKSEHADEFAVTDDQGKFRLSESQLPTMLRVRAAGYGPWEQAIDETTSGLLVTMAQAGVARGRLVDRLTGDGVAGILVETTSVHMSNHARASSNQAGLFTIEGVALGENRLVVIDRAWTAPSLEFSMGDQDIGELVVEVERAHELEVWSSLDNTPCQGEVRLLGFRGDPVPILDGLALVQGVVKGTHALEVDCVGGLLVRETVEVGEEQRKTVHIKIEQGSVLNGLVLSEHGKPVSDLTVYCSSEREGSTRCQEKTSQDGTFTCQGLLPVSYLCEAQSDGQIHGVPVAGTPGSDHLVRLTVPTLASLKIVPDSPEDPTFSMLSFFLKSQDGDIHWATTTSATEVRFDHLRAGIYFAKCTDELLDFEVDLLAGGEHVRPVEAGTWTTVSGRVVDGDNYPIAAAVVRLSPQREGGEAFQRGSQVVLTDDLGNFIAEHQIGKAFRLLATSGSLTGELDDVRPGTPSLVQLRQPQSH